MNKRIEKILEKNEIEIREKSIKEIDCVNEGNVDKIWECYVDECECFGKVLSFKEFWEDIENSCGWGEVLVNY